MVDGGYYRQCTLKNGTKKTTSWLPEKFAQKGRGVSLKKDDGTWDDGWAVVEIGTRLHSDQVHDREYLKHRSVTDI